MTLWYVQIHVLQAMFENALKQHSLVQWTSQYFVYHLIIQNGRVLTYSQKNDIFYFDNNMNIVKQLKDVGLHQSEIDVYLYLLGNGYSTPPQVSRGTKIARTNCYNVLSSLKDKGLIKEEQRRKRKVYLASDPEALLLSLEKKKMALEGVIPDLKALFITQKNKPQVKSNITKALIVFP